MKNQSVSNYAVDEKLAALNRVAQLQADGVPLVEACRQAGVSPASILRWREAYRIGGVVGLKPKAAPGRPSYAELLSEDAMARIRELALKTGSIALAYDIFQADPLCPEEIRDVLSRRRNGDAVPLSLMRAARVTPEVKAMHRGQKTYQLNSFTALRDMTEITPDGARRQIEPGDWWELDDMSLNHPFWYEADCPVCGANGNRDEDCRPIVSPRCSKLAHAHGVEVGRQSLWALDVASCKWLGVEMVGRRQDAYRAEDILRFLRKLFGTYGMPRRGLRLERGVWMSRRITGIELKPALMASPGYEHIWAGEDVPEMPESEQKVIVGGLTQLGIEVVYCWSPHSKGMIESSFDHLQSIAATMGDR